MNKKEIIIAQDKAHLKLLIVDEIRLNGKECDLNHIDVSNITSMSWIFAGSNFNGDISSWDVGNVIEMNCMFQGANFNGDISKWDVSNVSDMSWMFYYSNFNGDISKWNVEKVTYMTCIFNCSKFQKDVNEWKPYSLIRSIDFSDNIDFNMPCWGNLNSNEEIQHILKIRNEKEALEKELNSITNHTTKNKMKL